jgi:hypothetical protein
MKRRLITTPEKFYPITFETTFETEEDFRKFWGNVSVLTDEENAQIKEFDNFVAYLIQTFGK